mgnify:CR=1 FL=1
MLKNSNTAMSTRVHQPRVFTSKEGNKFHIRDFYDQKEFCRRIIDKIFVNRQEVELSNGAYISREKAKVLSKRLKEAIEGGNLDNNTYKTSMAEALLERYNGNKGYLFYCFHYKGSEEPLIRLDKIVEVQPPYKEPKKLEQRAID